MYTYDTNCSECATEKKHIRETSKQARLTRYIYTYDTNCSENKAEDNKIIQMAQFSGIFSIQVNLI